jgi:hypothetical protein
MNINLNTEKNFIVIQEKKILTSSVTVFEIKDMPLSKKVIAYIKLGNTNNSKQLILWEGQEYDNIGQWTDLDAHNRIKFLCENI